MVFSQIFRYFLVFSGVAVLVRRLVCLCLIVVFDLSPSYCGVWFIVGLSQRGAFCRLIATLYLYEGDSNSKILYYGC